MNILRKRWLMMVIIVAAGCSMAGYIGTVYLEPVYRATGKIIVSKSAPDGSVGTGAGDATVSTMLINTYKELIRTPQIVQQVVQTHPELNVTAEQLLESLQVSVAPGSQIMNVSWKDRSFEHASGIVNAVIQQFQRLAPDILHTDHVMIAIPADPTTPSSSEQVSLPVVLLAAFIASTIVAGFLALLLEALHSGLRDTDQVEYLLEVPVLATIPVIRKHDYIQQTAKSSVAGFVQTKEDRHVRFNG
jgi:capsular polysaccharide biosynthesis protein